MLFLGLIVLLIIVIIYLNQRKKPLYTDEELNRYTVHYCYVPSDPIKSMWQTFKNNRKRFKFEEQPVGVNVYEVSVVDTEVNLQYCVRVVHCMSTGKPQYIQLEGLECFNEAEINWLCDKIYIKSKKSLERLRRMRGYKFYNERLIKEQQQKQKYIDLYCK